MRRFKIIIAFLFTAVCANAQDATQLYNEGVSLKKDKDISGAIEKFRKAVALKPDYDDAYYEMGWCLNDKKEYSSALSSLRKALRSRSDYAKVNYETGYSFEKLDLKDSAKYYYNRCLNISPTYSLALKQLAYMSYNNGEDNAAILAAFEKYEAVALEKGPISDYLYWYRKGFTQNALKIYSAAKQSLIKSMEIKPDYINTWLELGFASKNLKQDEDAISYYTKAMDLDPKSHIPYNGIGEVYRDNKKDPDMAISWYSKSLAINPNERKANFGLGYCMNSKAKYSEAIPYLKKAIENEATYTAAYVELGYSLYMTNDFSSAKTNLLKALQLNNKNENARYYLGLLYIKLNDKTNAQQMVNELSSMNSKNAASLQEKVNKM